MWCFVAFGGEKCEAEAGAYRHQDVTFRRRFAASDEKKGKQEPLPFTG